MGNACHCFDNEPLTCMYCGQSEFVVKYKQFLNGDRLERDEEKGTMSKPNSQKDNQATSENWEEEFLDKFSVMLERAGREEGESSGDWEIYCLDFIRELLQSQKDRLKGKIETLYHHGDVRTKLILKEVIKLLE
jgi:hypothetical protein